MSKFEFSKGYSTEKPCPYQIGQFVPQFYPMNYEANKQLPGEAANAR